MKKLLILSLVSLVILSSLVLAAECSKNLDCDDGLKYTKDICENSGTEESYCINEVSNPNLSLLGKILDALKELILKDWTINVEPTPITIEPNITVEPPQVTVNPEVIIESENGMAKRGNIVLREQEREYQGNIVDIGRTSKPAYVSLPNGTCDLTISSDCSGTHQSNDCEISIAKDINTIGSGFPCRNDCSGTVTIDDEYYMIKIQPDTASLYSYMRLTYNCA